MKKVLTERSAVVFLFILVLIVFSFAERETKKVFSQYPSSTEPVVEKIQSKSDHFAQRLVVLTSAQN